MHSIPASSSRQPPATPQHSEHALLASLTVSSSSSSRLCSADMTSTMRLRPAYHVVRPPFGFMVASVNDRVIRDSALITYAL
ncbi:unnamed protein product [Somion occarium]|uniref:Uncharacterized protein n=1 Tax=Somion occarium TaxID=3059160 RepID=A0ABP1D0Z2_9APHY